MTLDIAITQSLGAFALDVAFRSEGRGITALFGPSGAGKTSIVRAIAGLKRPDTGRIDIDGELSETRVLDVSLGGARLAGTAPAEVGTNVTVVLDGMSIRGTVLRIGSDDYVVRFEETAETKVKLIRFVYSGRFSADVPRIQPARVAAATIGRVMR